VSDEVRSKTALYFTTYDEKKAEDILHEISIRYNVIELKRSTIIKELYYVALEGRHPEISDLVRNVASWFKVDVLEFR
jgi:hypothetical protein